MLTGMARYIGVVFFSCYGNGMEEELWNIMVVVRWGYRGAAYYRYGGYITGLTFAVVGTGLKTRWQETLDIKIYLCVEPE